MATFTFGFHGDDIEDELETERPMQEEEPEIANSTTSLQAADQVNTKSWALSELLQSLPSHVAYFNTAIEAVHGGDKIIIPRRSLFDVRLQIMAENEDMGDATQELGLGESDIEQNVYEGGFKSWEGALDLARYLHDSELRDESTRIVELGCGTALPSLVLFRQDFCTSDAKPDQTARSYTLADFNHEVLRLVVVPNLLLVWASVHATFSANLAVDVTKGIDGGQATLSPDLVQAFLADLLNRHMTLQFLSGPWSQSLAELMDLGQRASLTILAAETIYSPSSLASFTGTLLAMLRRVEGAKALVAAKRIYFGVGGSVAEFTRMITQDGASVTEIEGAITDEGVGRCILKVQVDR